MMGWLLAAILLIILYTKKADFENPISYLLWCAVMFAVMMALVLLGVSYAASVEHFNVLALCP